MSPNGTVKTTRIDDGLVEFKKLLASPTTHEVTREELVQVLQKYPDVFGDPEEYIKYLFQVGALDAKRRGNTYVVSAA